jgi:type IV pilus assembly protein PilP
MLTILLVALIAAAGQAATTPARPAQSSPAAEQVPGAAGYSYNPEGRRDPFVSLVGRGNDPKQAAHAAGIPGLLVNEVTVKGVIRGRSGYIAMIQGPDNKTYIVHSGDRLLDGSVKSVSQDGVVFSQDVNDPLSLVKQREVPKRIRAAEGRG